GRIIKTTRTDYAEHVGRGDMADVVRAIMKEQHKAMFISLRAGELDTLLEPNAGVNPVAKASAAAARGAPETAAAASRVAGQGAAGAPATKEASAQAQRPLSNPNLRKVAPSMKPPGPNDIELDVGSLDDTPAQKPGMSKAEQPERKSRLPAS